MAYYINNLKNCLDKPVLYGYFVNTMNVKSENTTDLLAYQTLRLQDLIKEIMREKLFDEGNVSSEELDLILKLVKASQKDDLYSTEKDLFDKLQ